MTAHARVCILVAGMLAAFVALSTGPGARPANAKREPAANGAKSTRGADLFRRHCRSCHGAQGRGDGSRAPFLRPRPRDLTHPETFRFRTPSEIAEVIRSGGRATGLSPAMPAWAGRVDEAGIRALVEHVQALGARTSASER